MSNISTNINWSLLVDAAYVLGYDHEPLSAAELARTCDSSVREVLDVIESQPDAMNELQNYYDQGAYERRLSDNFEEVTNQW